VRVNESNRLAGIEAVARYIEAVARFPDRLRSR